MKDIILSVQGMNKRFGAVYAANDINVDVKKGSCIGLIGSNGAGKTTFVNMVTGYLKPDSGIIKFHGNDITELSPREVSRKGIARSFQIPQLYGSMTALENLEMSFGVVALNAAKKSFFIRPENPVPGYDGKSIKELADETLDRFGLIEFRNQTTKNLPGGVRKLIDIAMAMATKPEILFLDEPTSGVSAEEKFDIMDMVMNVIKREGTTVLFVEHDMEIVSRHADRVLAFYDGSIIVDDRPEVTLKNPQVLKYIVGSAHDLNVEANNHA